MESYVFQFCPAYQPSRALRKCASCDRKHAGTFFRAIERQQNGGCRRSEGNGPGATVVGLGDVEELCRKVDVVPLQRQKLPAAHGRFQGKADEGNDQTGVAVRGGLFQLTNHRVGDAVWGAVVASGFADLAQRIGGKGQAPFPDGNPEHVLVDAQLPADGCGTDAAQSLVPVGCKLSGTNVQQGGLGQLGAQERIENDRFHFGAAFFWDLFTAIAMHKVDKGPLVHRYRGLPGLDAIQPGFLFACPGACLSTPVETSGEGRVVPAPDLDVPFPISFAYCCHISLRSVPAVCPNGGRVRQWICRVAVSDWYGWKKRNWRLGLNQ
jgi:hypothetical protein